MSESSAKLTRKGKASRDAILEAATALFAEKGVAATSISEIAARVGLNRAMIAYHFGSKGALYDAIIDAAVADATAGLGDLDVAADAEPERRLVQAFAEMIGRRPQFARMIIHEYFQPGRLFEPQTAQRLTGMMALTERMLRSVPLGPRAKAYDPQVVHLICIGALVFFSLTTSFRSRMAGRLGRPITQPSMDEFADTLADLLSAGLRRERPKLHV